MDLVLALVLSSVQFGVLWQVWMRSGADHFALRIGSPLSLLLGPAIYVLYRKGAKSSRRTALDRVVLVVMMSGYLAFGLAAGPGTPALSDILTFLYMFLLPAVAEALALALCELLWTKITRGTHAATPRL